MEWAAIIAVILDMIRECMENRNESQVEADLVSPGPFIALVLRRRLRKKTSLRGPALGNAVQECMADLQLMTPAEVGDLMADAKEED